MIRVPGLGFFFRIYTHDELMEESFWILRLVSSVCATGAAMQILVASGLTAPAIAFLALSAATLAASFVRIYWVRFGAMAAWTAVIAFDLYQRRNPCGVFFLAVGLYYIYKMLKYSQMHEGRTVIK